MKQKRNIFLIKSISIGVITSFLIIVSFIISAYCFFSTSDNFSQWVKILGVNEENSEITNLSQTILDEESAIINVVSSVSASVVSIAVEQVEYNPLSGPQMSEDNIGTGFIISSDGLIVTNQHVVSNEDMTYSVTTVDKKVYDVTAIYRDEVYDVALVQIQTDGEKLSSVELGDSDQLELGQTVIAIGTPLGDYPGSVTSGIVSGLERTVTIGSDFWSSSKEYENVIQTDAAVNPGNSGGPLLNSAGQVVGINFATTSDADNISFAIPINTLKDRLEDFEANGGKFVKPYLGVSYNLISEYDSFRFSIPKGAFIDDLEIDGPADLAGIEVGDIIVEINEESVSEGLQNVILNFKSGETVTVKIWRKTGKNYSEGEYVEISVELGETEG